MSSYEKINYNLRPAKAAERKMLCELIQHLSVFHKLSEYQYIGFGSTYFTDFNLFHRSLGIEKMISIEKDIDNADRFLFNKPFSCIKMEFSSSNDILPTLDFSSHPTILWLDYDYELKSSCIIDIQTFVANAAPGSLLLTTVNAHTFKQNTITEVTDEVSKENNKSFHDKFEEQKEFRYDQLAKNIGESRIPAGITGADLSKNGISKVYHKVITNEIKSTLSQRNGDLEDNQLDFLRYEQLIFIKYDDGAPMITIGGLIYDNRQNVELRSKSKLLDLDFITKNDVPYKIEVPSLTLREIQQLDTFLPHCIDLKNGRATKDGEGSIIEDLTKIIPLRDIKKYAKLYRYFPNFSETNF